MKEIQIGPRGQLLMLLGVLGVVAAIIAAQMPEIQRYLKVRSM
jgi:hypothetical protein